MASDILAVVLVAVTAIATAATTAASTPAHAYHAASIAGVAVRIPTPAGLSEAKLIGSREGSASPAVRPWGVSTTPLARTIAAEQAAGLKGPLADEVASNLPEQMALDSARAANGEIIIRNLGDEPDHPDRRDAVRG